MHPNVGKVPIPAIFARNAGITALIYRQGNGETVALITDGRLSGATRGMCIGYACPEARAGGPIAPVRDGDMIEIDASPGVGTISVALTDAELGARGGAGGAVAVRGGLLEIRGCRRACEQGGCHA